MQAQAAFSNRVQARRATIILLVNFECGPSHLTVPAPLSSIQFTGTII